MQRLKDRARILKRDTIALYLQQSGFDVVTARDGVTGLQLATAGDAGLILLDLTMPILGGAEAASELRRIQPDTPIIAMSGYGDIEVMQRFGEVGVDDFLPKPFTPDQLAAKVRDLLAPVS